MPITTEPRGPKPPLPGGIKIQFNYSGSAGGLTFIAANVMHALVAPASLVTQTLVTNIAQFSRQTWAGNFPPSIASSWKVVNTTATAVDGSGLQGQDNTNVPGTATGLYPPQCAVAITWKGAIPWRGGRPRTYLPGVPTSASSGSSQSSALSSSYTSVLAAAAITFISQMNAMVISGGSLTFGLISYYSRGAFRSTPLFVPITTAVVHDRLDSQRRRSGKERTFPID